MNYEDLVELWEKKGVTKILEEWYRERITEWLDDIQEADFEEIETEFGEKMRAVWLGSIYSITPSGKMYTFWCSNVSPKEALMDTIFQDVLEEEAEKRGWSVYWRDEDIFVIDG